MYKILIIEDDLVISNSIKSHLSSWNYNVLSVDDFKNIIDCFTQFSPELILLDISLPYYNGYHWCCEIRKLSNVPIIFISSMADNMNIVMAINMGADDFIIKPFDLNVLTAKVAACLRRSYDFSSNSHLISHENIILNTDDTSLFIDGSKLELTKNEYKILKLLLESKGNLVNRDAIMTRLWETDSFIDDNTLTVNIARLRKKLDENGAHNIIKTKKGMGYII